MVSHLVATAFLVAVLACTVSAAGVAAESKARSWLGSHRDAPQGDELADLKATDPTSYEIVKALLTKQKLGLLDPRHPTASFAAPKDSEDEGEEHVFGAAAFAKFAGPNDHLHQASGGEAAADTPAMYPEAGTAHQSMWNWKPASGAMEDQDVQSVLGAAGASKGGDDSTSNFLSKSRAPSQDVEAEQPASQPAPQQVSKLDSDSSLFSGAETPEAPRAVEAPDAAVAPASLDNPYLQGIDFGSRAKQDAVTDAAPAAPAAPTASANPYLDGIDLNSESPKKAPKKHDVDLSNNALEGFSWGGVDAPKPVASAAEESSVVTMDAPAPLEAAPSVTQAWQQSKMDGAASPSNDALGKWLGGAAMLQKQAVAPKVRQNTYMDDLGNMQ